MTVPLFGAEQEEATSDDYYTPSWVFEELGLRFDLDVAAPPGGVPWIPADKFYTKADDGLAQEWVGRVWMNPPYSETRLWVPRFTGHGNGVALLPFAKSGWFPRLWESGAAVAVLPVSMRFITDQVTTNSGSIVNPTALWAMGVECVEAIGRLGRVR